MRAPVFVNDKHIASCKRLADKYFREQCKVLGPIEGLPVPPEEVVQTTVIPLMSKIDEEDVWPRVMKEDEPAWNWASFSNHPPSNISDDDAPSIG